MEGGRKEGEGRIKSLSVRRGKDLNMDLETESGKLRTLNPLKLCPLFSQKAWAPPFWGGGEGGPGFLHSAESFQLRSPLQMSCAHSFSARSRHRQNHTHSDTWGVWTRTCRRARCAGVCTVTPALTISLRAPRKVRSLWFDS